MQNYIFDLYGTLVDIRTNEEKPFLWEKMAQLYSLQGAPYAPMELKRAFRAAVQKATETRCALSSGVPRAYVEPDILLAFSMLYTQKNLQPSVSVVTDTAVFFRTLSLHHISNYPSAVTVLKALREAGKGVFLLSNAQAVFTVPELRFLGLEPMFDGIILSSDVGVKKPHQEIFRALFTRYGLTPKTCRMVGNDAQADIEGALALGMDALYIHTKQSPRRPEKLPEGCGEIRDLSELIQSIHCR